MNIKAIYILSIMSLAAFAATAADDLWTYNDCVEYARNHNISLQKLRLNEQTADFNLEEAEAQWQPTLDFATTHGYTNMPWGEGNKNALNGNFGLNAGWTVWNGGEREKNIERNKLNIKISSLATQDALRTLQTDLLQVYLNILYARESIAIYSEAEKLSRAQSQRMEALMESGKASRVDYAQLKAQHEQDLYNLVNAQGTYDTRRMELKRLLEIGIEGEIDLAALDIADRQILAELPPIDESYQLAVETDLQLQSLKLNEEEAGIDVELAKASGRPRISLNAGVGTNYFVPGGNFGTQLKQGVNEKMIVRISA